MKATLPATKQRSYKILSECCQRGIAARVISPYGGDLHEGALVNIDSERVVVRVAGPADFTSQNDDLCCVIFDYKDRPHVFLSAIINVTGNSNLNISIAVPEDIAAAERREIDRI